MTRTRLNTDTCVPIPVVTEYATTQIIRVKSEMTVREALDKGLVNEDDPNLPQDVDEILAIEHDTEQVVIKRVTEHRVSINRRTRPSSHYSHVPEEIVYASYHPLSFVPREFQDLYTKYVEGLKGTVCESGKVPPKVVVFLSSEIGKSRANFLIINYESLNWIVIDESGDRGEITLTPAQRKHGFQRSAVLFFSSKIGLHDLYINKDVI
jgi:hypothetical protein